MNFDSTCQDPAIWCLGATKVKQNKNTSWTDPLGRSLLSSLDFGPHLGHWLGASLGSLTWNSLTTCVSRIPSVDSELMSCWHGNHTKTIEKSDIELTGLPKTWNSHVPYKEFSLLWGKCNLGQFFLILSWISIVWWTQNFLLYLWAKCLDILSTC